ncbi:MAG: hypothetical protein RRY55_02685 [Bacteroidales bacterium]
MQRSNHEPQCKCTVCERLVGRYPKYFKFKGWHPQCRCHAVPILKTIEELKGDTERIINGEPTNTDSVNTVNQMPDSFTNWIEENKGRFGANNTPYFIRDNFKDGKIAEGLIFASGIDKQVVNNIIVPKLLSIQERADIRHQNRTEEQEGAIRSEWNERKATVIMGDKPIDSIIEVQGVMDRFFKMYPEETNAKAITVGIYKQASKRGSFSIMHANSPAGVIEFNNICYPHLKDSPYTRLKVALNKIKNKAELTFDEEYSIESFYHEILHCKAKQWERLKPHNKGDYKRTAMEVVNQFVSRHEYKGFIERLGGKALNQQQVLDNGMGYSNWVGGFRDFIKAAGLKEADACAYFKDKLLNSKYGELDNVLAGFIKQNSGNLLSGYSKKGILECLESGGSKWEFIIDLVKDNNKP